MLVEEKGLVQNEQVESNLAPEEGEQKHAPQEEEPKEGDDWWVPEEAEQVVPSHSQRHSQSQAGKYVYRDGHFEFEEQKQ